MLFEKEELFSASIDVGADIIPRVVGVVLVSVGPRISQIDLARFRANISKGIQHMREFVGRKVLRVKVAAVNSLCSLY